MQCGRVHDHDDDDDDDNDDNDDDDDNNDDDDVDDDDDDEVCVWGVNATRGDETGVVRCPNALLIVQLSASWCLSQRHTNTT